jgi:hypothetical protein
MQLTAYLYFKTPRGIDLWLIYGNPGEVAAVWLVSRGYV